MTWESSRDASTYKDHLFFIHAFAQNHIFRFWRHSTGKLPRCFSFEICILNSNLNDGGNDVKNYYVDKYDIVEDYMKIDYNVDEYDILINNDDDDGEDDDKD